MAEELVDEKPLDEEPAELTDEDLDRIADTAIGALQDICLLYTSDAADE